MSRSRRIPALVARREQLIARAAHQREQLAAALAPMQHAALSIDARMSVARGWVSNPLVIGAAVGALVMVGPRRLIGLVRRGATAWLMARTWLPTISALFARRL